MNKEYVAPPYRIKMVEPIKITTKEERVAYLHNAGYNPFSLRSEDVYIDLLTDSGTGAMSHYQWAALMQGDEAYAGSRSFFKFEAVVKDITGYQYIIPAHQGRGAEQVVLPQLVKHDSMVFISNMHFDTTRAHVEIAGARAIDCVIDACFDTEVYHPFKGNFDVKRLEQIVLEKGKENVAGIIMTITNNSAGGQPVDRSGTEPGREGVHAVVVQGPPRRGDCGAELRRRGGGEDGHTKRRLAPPARGPGRSPQQQHGLERLQPRRSSGCRRSTLPCHARHAHAGAAFLGAERLERRGCRR